MQKTNCNKLTLFLKLYMFIAFFRTVVQQKDQNFLLFLKETSQKDNFCTIFSELPEFTDNLISINLTEPGK